MKLNFTIGVAAIFVTFSASADDFQYKGAPSFTYGCDMRGHDDMGDPIRRYCWLNVSNMSGPGMLIGNAYVMSQAKILEVDASGIKIVRAPNWEGCDVAPRRMAVDGKRIDGLPKDEQLRRLASGSIYLRDEQAPWPNCRMAPRGTRLDGFREALDAMTAEWSAYRS
ncbi:hypothetical protein [Ancylobacter polymorphus]|uniref:Uncharacterized protein n=1 Tax=Ancylobacter polymorphus TaxID=223390 RepID=A0A9E6ZU08_9HYPH|nr:hypothetical protein [Ancylobacter polymorphus]UOK71714.1 hypothetical protein K9D25_03025 [Ancylobacter polymorphus]